MIQEKYHSPSDEPKENARSTGGPVRDNETLSAAGTTVPIMRWNAVSRSASPRILGLRIAHRSVTEGKRFEVGSGIRIIEIRDIRPCFPDFHSTDR